MCKKSGAQPVFTKTQEKILVSIFQYYESHLLGFTTLDVRIIAFELAVEHKLKHNFNMKEELAGKDWPRGFTQRNPVLSFKKLELTSVARAHSFNDKAVKRFFDTLEEAITANNILPENIYNCDETPISIIPKGTTKVLATRGTRQVGGLVTGKRGEHVTANICFSAVGKYIPPLIIFPRKIFNGDYLKGKSDGAIVEFHPSGYMTSDLFVNWIKHFIKYSEPSAEKKVLLFFD